MRQTIKRWGNSPALRIPGKLMEAMALDIDAEVEIRLVTGEGKRPQLIIERVEQAPTLAALLAQVTPENLHEEVRTGETGKEIW